MPEHDYAPREALDILFKKIESTSAELAASWAREALAAKNKLAAPDATPLSRGAQVQARVLGRFLESIKRAFCNWPSFHYWATAAPTLLQRTGRRVFVPGEAQDPSAPDGAGPS